MKLKVVAMACMVLAPVTFFPMVAHASPPPPFVEITPSTGLVDGQTVAVTVGRFGSMDKGKVEECLAPPVGAPNHPPDLAHPAGGTCGVGTLVKVTTDSNSILSKPNYTLKETFTDRNGDAVNCGAAPPPESFDTTCVLLVTLRDAINGKNYAYADLPFAS